MLLLQGVHRRCAQPGQSAMRMAPPNHSGQRDGSRPAPNRTIRLAGGGSALSAGTL